MRELSVDQQFRVMRLSYLRSFMDLILQKVTGNLSIGPLPGGVRGKRTVFEQMVFELEVIRIRSF